MSDARVKPLVWRETNDGNRRKGECFSTRSPVSFAPIAAHKKHDGWWLNVDCKTYPTLEAAKAAAQADYAARIMAAIDVVDVAELVEERDAALSAASQQDKLREVTLATLRGVSANLEAAEAKVAELVEAKQERDDAMALSNETIRQLKAAKSELLNVEFGLADPVAVHQNMLRGTIAKPTVEQIIHLYGVDALCRALAPAIVRESGHEPAPDVMAELVEAAKGVMRHMPDYADTAWQELDAALAKIKEPTP